MATLKLHSSLVVAVLPVRPSIRGRYLTVTTNGFLLILLISSSISLQSTVWSASGWTNIGRPSCRTVSHLANLCMRGKSKRQHLVASGIEDCPFLSMAVNMSHLKNVGDRCIVTAAVQVVRLLLWYYAAPIHYQLPFGKRNPPSSLHWFSFNPGAARNCDPNTAHFRYSRRPRHVTARSARSSTTLDMIITWCEIWLTEHIWFNLSSETVLQVKTMFMSFYAILKEKISKHKRTWLWRTISTGSL